MTPSAPWTAAEDTRLSAARTLDVPWDVIVRDYLSGRTEPAAKARFVLLLSRSEREQVNAPQVQHAPSVPAQASPEAFPNVPRPAPHDDLASTETALRRAETSFGCDTLRDRTAELFAREATRRGTTPQAIRLVLNYAPDELRKMASAAQAMAA